MKPLVSFGLLFLLFVSACKKEPPLTNEPPDVPNDTIPADTAIAYHPSWPMVKEVVSMYNGQITYGHYYYDSLWRLVRYEQTGSSTYTDSFTYTGNYVYRNGVPYCSLNNVGLIESKDITYNSTSYSFNTDSQLTTITNAHYGVTAGWVAGNKASQHEWTENGGWSIGYHDYTYYYNSHFNSIGNYNTGQYYLGHSPVNLPGYTLWHRYLSSGGNGIYGFNLYSYTYNDSGRVSTAYVQYAEIYPQQIDSVTTIYDTTYSNTLSNYTYY